MPDLHPIATMPAWWWLILGALAIAGISFLSIAALQLRRRPEPVEPDDSLGTLRAATLAAIDAATRQEPGTAACRSVVAEARRFVGIVTDSSVDYLSDTQLSWAARRNPRLLPIAQLVHDTQEWCFSPTATPDVDDVADRAREVVREWR